MQVSRYVYVHVHMYGYVSAYAHVHVHVSTHVPDVDACIYVCMFVL